MVVPLAIVRNVDIARACFRNAAPSVVIGALLYAATVAPAHSQMLGLRAAVDARSPKRVVANAMAEASHRFHIPLAWLRAVMHAESHGDASAVSDKGAIGLMQVMPATYEEMRAKHGFGRDPFDPRDNILAGAAYLSEMFSRYGESGFLAAYNAGPGRYEKHLALGRALPAETTDYVARIAPRLGLPTATGMSEQAQIDTSRAPIFFTNGAPFSAPEPSTDGARTSPRAENSGVANSYFPGPSIDKIFAAKSHPDSGSKAPPKADRIQAAGLFVARPASESIP